MNKSKSGRNKIKQRSAVSRKLLMQYVISIIGYVVGVMLFVFVAWRFCMMFIWQPDDPLYILLQTVKEYIILFLGITFLIGWVFITYYFISKPLRYLDEVVVATEQLVVPSDEPIVLPNEMFYAENELNRVREKALDNTFQVVVEFDDEYMYGSILSQNSVNMEYKVYNSSVSYVRENGKVYQIASVCRTEKDITTGKDSQKELYINRCEIGYELDGEIEIEERGANDD